MIQTTNSGQLDADLEQNQSINYKDTFKGRCSLCLDFDFKGHTAHYQRSLIGYLHAKFEQNQSTRTENTL